jgi:glycosyltransferase involved in cell wall biosynthesis
MHHIPKLLVLGSYLPGNKAGGGVVQDEILHRYPRDRYVCFSVNPRDRLAATRETAESLRGVPCLIGPMVPRPHWRGARFYLPWLRAWGFHGLASWRVRQAVAFGRRHGVDLIWAELQGDALVIAQKVAIGLGVPFVGTIWDDPEGWLIDWGYDRLSQRLLQQRFRAALKEARHLSTAGEAMQQAYAQQYGVKSVILRHGFAKPILPEKRLDTGEEIIIGFVGSTYGRDAWTAFLAAVAALNASGRLPAVKLRVFGGEQFPYRQEGVEIEVRGWQSQHVMLQQIAETDFCYLQYWFDPQKRRHAELSFPNKFETYLAAGRPVLCHGPEYAGIAATIREYDVGLCVHSLNPKEIAAAVERLIVDRDLRWSLGDAAIKAFYQEFNAAKMMANFAELIGLAPGDLAADSSSSSYAPSRSRHG